MNMATLDQRLGSLRFSKRSNRQDKQNSRPAKVIASRKKRGLFRTEQKRNRNIKVNRIHRKRR
jgi:hypothetical protein